jgi:predicted transcriptional regulator of viral defense system
MTERPVRAGSQERHGASFTLRHVRPGMIFGTKSVWRGRTRIAVSDVHRTIVDMLDDPELGAGIQHVDDCLASYFGRRDRNDDRLVAYADRLGNGAVFKRLGFLAERGSGGTALVDDCRERLTQGNAKLDPALPCRRLVTRWRLFVPEKWIPAAPA